MNIRLSVESFSSHHLHEVEPNGDITLSGVARDHIVRILQTARESEPIPAYQQTLDALIDALRG